MTNQASFAKALDYLDNVKRMCPENYLTFLEMMKAYKSRALTTHQVIVRVRMLFATKDELLKGFDVFLPEGYCLYRHDLSTEVHGESRAFGGEYTRVGERGGFHENGNEESVSRTANFGSFFCGVQGGDMSSARNAMAVVSFEDARNFVKMVRTTYQNEPQVYRRFLEILHLYHHKKISLTRVYKRITMLFHGHPQLVQGFTYFLPNAEASNSSSDGTNINIHESNIRRYQNRRAARYERLLDKMITDSIISREEAKVILRRIRVGRNRRAVPKRLKSQIRNNGLPFQRMVNRNRRYTFKTLEL